MQPGDRVATLAWNGYRHMELYFGVSGMGAVLHTVNPRLFPEQLDYIVNHAEDTVLFFDLSFVPLVEKLAAAADQRARLRADDRPRAHARVAPSRTCCATRSCSRRSPTAYAWPELDENTASSLCYTSGTTGMPKGVLYSHRSTVLHAFGACTVDSLAVSASETALLVVPMFHVNAWGMPYAGAMSGRQAGAARPGARRRERLRS